MKPACIAASLPVALDYCVGPSVTVCKCRFGIGFEFLYGPALNLICSQKYSIQAVAWQSRSENSLRENIGEGQLIEDQSQHSHHRQSLHPEWLDSAYILLLKTKKIIKNLISLFQDKPIPKVLQQIIKKSQILDDEY